MAEAAKNTEFDGVLSVPGGCDSSRSPYVITEGASAWGENVTYRGDYPRNRPGWTRRAVLEGVSGWFQGASFYRADNGINQIFMSFGGRDWIVTPNLGFQLSEVTIPGDPNSSILSYNWFVQAENYLIKNDGQSAPIFYDGASSRRAGSGELTTGTVAYYAAGRVWYAVSGGTAYRAGDLVRSSSGSQVYQYRDAVLKLTENNLINGGGSFSIPYSSGTIKAMGTPAILDTSLGQGPLQIFTDQGAFSVNAPVDRTLWASMTDPVQTVSALGGGAVGGRALTLVNGDIFFRANDGIRTFFVARRNYNEGWSNTPISDEVKRVLDFDNVYQLPAQSMVLFKNRLLGTIWGRRSNYGIYHAGVVALDFDPVSSMRNKEAPRWEGLWTGLKILQLVVGSFNNIDRCFAIVLNTSYLDQLEIWELNEESLFDNLTVRIPSAIESIGLFRGSPFAKKELTTARMFYSGLVGTVDFNMKYRPDNWPCWVDWHSWSECASPDECLEDECLVEGAALPQYRPRISLPNPPDACNPSTKEPLRLFYQMQYRMAWAGPAVINQTRIDSLNKLDSPNSECPTAESCRVVKCCDPNPLEYEV